MQDISFLIPFRVNSLQRIRNLKLMVNYLLQNFKSKIFIYEDGKSSNQKIIWDKHWDSRIEYFFHYSNEPLFWRSKIVNDLVRLCNTKYFVMQDIDFIVKKTQFLEAYQKLKNYDFVLPYENNVMWIPDEYVNKLKIIDDKEISTWNFETSQQRSEDFIFVGGIGLFNKQSFNEAGGLNENIKGWGFEDVEFYERFSKLGNKVVRIPGLAYHLNHPVLQKNDYVYHDMYDSNEAEYEKVRAMNKLELRKYISNSKEAFSLANSRINFA